MFEESQMRAGRRTVVVPSCVCEGVYLAFKHKYARGLIHRGQHSDREENTRNTKIDLGSEEPHSLLPSGGRRKAIPLQRETG